jgi:modulator of FtsH protease HflK
VFRYLLYVGVIAFVGWTAYTSLTQVQSHERAVVRRFGRTLPDKPKQGLHIGLPWGIDRVDLAPVGRVRSIKVGLVDNDDKADEVVPVGQMLTGDHNLVNVQASINFKVHDDEADMEKFVLHQDAIDAFVARAAESLLAEWVAARKVEDVLRHGKSELPAFLHEHLQARLEPYGLGVEVETASISKLVVPEQVKEAFEKVAQVQNSIDEQVKQAKQQAYGRQKEAESQAERIERQALAYAHNQQSQAVTEASNFLKRLAQYRELSRTNPDYLDALWLDEMTRTYAQMKETGRLELLDHFLTSEGLSITQFPLRPKKK